MKEDNNERWNRLMERIVSIDDRSAGTMRNVEKVERATAQTLRDLESKDFKDMMNQIHNALDRNHYSVTKMLPDVMGDGESALFPSKHNQTC